MCDPGTLATIGTVTALVGSGVGAYGQIQQGKAAKKAGEYNAQVADMNAKISMARSRDAIDRSAMEEQDKRREVAQVKGRQEAALAANGVDAGYGSALDTLVDTSVFGELDALTIRANGYREAYGHNVDAANKTAEAGFSRMEGKNAKRAGYLGATTTMLSGVSDAFSSWSKRQKPGYA